MFDQVCQKFRVKWLDEREMAESDGVQALDVADRHQRDCSECARWVRGAKLQVQIFEELGWVEVPEELDTLVEEVLATPPSEDRIEEVMAALPQRPAPEELEERVAADLIGRQEKKKSTAGDDRSTQSVRTLDVEPAPQVLGRLVDEELTKPEVHRTERFVGNLAPQKAPSVLARRIATELRQRSVLKLVAAPVATLAAAALIFWVAVRGGDEGAEVGRSFEVVYVDDAKGLDPFARRLAEALGGSASNAIAKVPESGEEEGEK